MACILQPKSLTLASSHGDTLSLPMESHIAHLNMIKQQIRTNKVLAPHVLEVLETTNRADYVPSQFKALAYTDKPIPLAHGQEMLTPLVEATMLQALNLKKSDKVLEIGTGSGYFTTLLAKSCVQVYTVEIFEDFSSQAAAHLMHEGLQNVNFLVGDGSVGWRQFAPYDAIVITASIPHLPDELKQQLTQHGHICAIVGIDPVMSVISVERHSLNRFECKFLMETSAIPLIVSKTEAQFVF